MIIRTIFSSILIVIAFWGNAQKAFTDFSIATIPDSLKKDANAVFRVDETFLEIHSPSSYTEKVHQVISILNAEGSHHLQQDYWFDKFNKIDGIEVKVYNNLGLEVQRYKKKDFNVVSYYDGISLVTDDKLMRLRVAAPQYPCTIEIRYERTNTSYIDLPDQYLNNFNNGIEYFQYTVIVPSKLGIRYRSVNMMLNPVTEVKGDYVTYSWTAKEVAAKKIETGGYSTLSYAPRIEISPNAFEYDGYKGAMKNWMDFGKWCYTLYEEQPKFSDQRRAEINAIIKDAPNVRSKVALLYNYLQKNTRYVSIQLGIGGFKPFAAAFVDQNKYGDCKALTNYMRMLLETVGIKSYPALVNAGYSAGSVDASFPANKFNHVILCVPNGNDSIWLECTSSNNEAGFLGSFTENKNALLLKPGGGVVVSTPKSDYHSNTIVTASNIYLDAEGGAKVKTRISTTGSFYQLADEINKMESERQKELIVRYMNFKDGEDFEKDEQADAGEIKFATVYSRLFEFKAGSKFFFPLSICEINTESLTVQNNRSTEYLFQFPYKKTDTSTYFLNKEFEIDNIPPNKSINNKYFDYKREIKYEVAAQTITAVSTLQLKNHVIAASDYAEVCKVLNEINKECKEKLIFKKTDGVLHATTQ